jgi:hypothetical protein
MLAGFLYLRYGRGASPLERYLRRWRRRHLELIDGAGGPVPEDPRLEGEIDRILDKISEHGLDSLTPEEEKILDEASRRRKRD